MQVISFLIPFICLFFVTSLFVKLTNKKYGDCFPITLVSLPLIVLLSHFICRNLIYGIYGIYVLVVASVIVFILNIKNADYRDKVFGNGFIVFAFIYIFLYIILRNAHYFAWDEFAHWGPMINQMVSTDKMYMSVSHAAYPPLIQTFEYILVKCGLPFEEDNIKFAVQFFNFTIFCLPVSERFESVKNEKLSILKIIGVFLISFLLAVGIDAYNSFRTIYLDVTMSLFFAYIGYLLIYKEDIYIIVLMSFAFMLVKDISILFILFIALYIFIEFISEIIGTQNKKEICSKYIKMILAIIGPAIISYLLWYAYKVSASLLNDQFAMSNFSLKSFFEIFVGKLDGEKLEGFNHFYHEVFHYNLAKGPLLFTYFTSFIILNAILIVFTFISKAENKLKIFIKMFVFIIITYTVYLLFMMNMYVNIFSGIERTGSASFGRYMSSFVLGIYLILFIYIYKNCKHSLALFITYSILTLLIGMNYFALKINPKVNQTLLIDPLKNERLAYLKLTNTLKPWEKSLVIIDNGFWTELVKEYYNVNKANIELYDIKKFASEDNIKLFLDNIKNYDYLYVIDVNNITMEPFVVMSTDYIQKHPEYKYNFNNVPANEIININNK